MQTNTALPTNEQNRTEYKTCDAELPEFAMSRVFGDHMVLPDKNMGIFLA